MDNNTKTLILNDSISSNDKHEIHYCNNGEELRRKERERFKRNKAPVFYTEIDVYRKDCNDVTSELGEKVFTGHNELVLPGAIFIAEKLLNVTAPIKPKTLNQDLGISISEETQPHGKRLEHVICLFGVGTGGCGTNFDTVVPVKFKERKLESLIPLRYVPTDKDLTSAEKQKYFMKKTNNGHYEYYLKKFEIDPTIKVEYDEPGNPAVPPNFDEVSGDKIINNYMQFNIKISKDDVREYFKAAGGGINKARINTLGLYIGYPATDGENEFKGVQLFSKINFNNEPLDNETKELNIIYRIYIS